MHRIGTARVLALTIALVGLISLQAVSAQAAACLRLAKVDVDQDQITLTNVGDAAQPAGYWVCNFPDYRQVNTAVAAGTSITVTLTGFLNNSAGEVGLYTTDSFGFADATAMIDYVEYGFAGHTRSGLAEGKGLWNDGGFVTVPASGKMQWNGVACGDHGSSFWSGTVSAVTASFGTLKSRFE